MIIIQMPILSLSFRRVYQYIRIMKCASLQEEKQSSVEEISQQEIQSQTMHLQYFKSRIDHINVTSSRSIQKILSNDRVQWSEDYAQTMTLRIISFDLQSMIIELHYGNFKMKIVVVFTFFDSKDFNQNICANGAFGTVLNLEDKYALKVINVDRINLRGVYIEYFIAFLASCLEVGPKIQKVMGYDIAILEKVAIFAMQMCMIIDQKIQTQQSLNDLFANLRVFHSLRLIHSDIKPENIMFSKLFSKYVFIDFGLSKFVRQPLGKKTLTTFVGTYAYSSRQMKKLSLTGGSQHIDLYFNDLKCLQNSIEKILKLCRQNEKSAIKSKPTQKGLIKNISSNYLSIVVRVIMMKYFVFNKLIDQIVQHGKQNIDCHYCFYQVLIGDYINDDLRKSSQIQQLISWIKEGLKSTMRLVEDTDYKLSKIINRTCFSLDLNISCALQLQDEKFEKIIQNKDFLSQLFLIFDPSSNIFSSLKTEKLLNFVNSIRIKIIQKIFSSISKNSEKSTLFHKLRVSLMFFYQNLKLKMDTVYLALSIRAIFLLIKDYSKMFEFDEEICLLTECKTERMLRIVQFSLCYDITCNYHAEDRCQRLKDIFQNIEIQNHEDKLKTIKQLCCSFLYRKKNYYRESDCKAEILNRIKILQTSLSTFHEIITNIKVLYHGLAFIRPPSMSHMSFCNRIYQSFNLCPKLVEDNFQYNFFVNTFCSFQKMEKQKRQGREEFQQSLMVYFESMKEIKVPTPIFMEVKNDEIFIRDFELLLFVANLQQRLWDNFSFYSQHEAYTILLTVQWYLKIIGQFQQYQTNIRGETCSEKVSLVVSLIQKLFDKEKQKMGGYKQKSSFRIILKSLQALITLFKLPLIQVDQSMFNGLIEQIEPINYPEEGVMPPLILFIFHRIGLFSNESTFHLYQQFTLKLCQAYVMNSDYNIFQSTMLLPLSVAIYTKRGEIEKSLTLIRSTMRLISKEDFFFIQNNIYPVSICFDCPMLSYSGMVFNGYVGVTLESESELNQSRITIYVIFYIPTFIERLFFVRITECTFSLYPQQLKPISDKSKPWNEKPTQKPSNISEAMGLLHIQKLLMYQFKEERNDMPEALKAIQGFRRKNKWKNEGTSFKHKVKIFSQTKKYEKELQLFLTLSVLIDKLRQTDFIHSLQNFISLRTSHLVDEQVYDTDTDNMNKRTETI